MDLFEEFEQRLTVHPQKAQILLALPDHQKAIERVLSILSSRKIAWEEYKVLNKVDPAIILIFLSPQDLTEAVMRLSEAGITKLKGLNQQKDIDENLWNGKVRS